MNKRALWVLIVLLPLLASACTFEFTTTVNEDATGKFVAEYGVTQEEIAQLEAFGGGSFSDMCTADQFAMGAPEDVTVVQEERGDESWCVATVTFEDLNGLVDAYTEMEVQINTLSMTEDEFVYDVTFGMGSDPDMDLSALTAMGVDINLVWQVVAPGSVIEDNADEVSGETLTWYLDATSQTNMQARTHVGGGGLNPLFLIGIVVVAVVVIAVIFLLARRKQEAPQEPQPPVV